MFKMPRHLVYGLILLFGCSMLCAAPNFPSLTGRVVDNAQLLTPQAKQALETQLKDYEQASTNQVVVLTLPSLNGYEIDDYGYQLGRHWQIGQKDKNNGVILIVAQTERKVRIEVGYGLEPILTDLLANQIIQTVILPSFKQDQYQKGIVEGTQTILDVLGGKKLKQKTQSEPEDDWVGLIFFIIICLLFIRNPGLAYLISSGSGQRFGGGGSSGGSSSSGGGFSGGGGSFGGGGSSGSW